ncbi:alpha/beta fold hydrolase [Intrasporangium sp. YIM S08009]|uniref:alpha/beta fold hydrolase n=1 Tax=Intrasporangium zincisolvens TaxID=3080018 RepID=UPI002B052CD0|nr:alpha/beta fold hydrolase [Intrasporangium sp. YIM S08009]
MSTTRNRRRYRPAHLAAVAAAGLAFGLGLAGCTGGTAPVTSSTTSARETSTVAPGATPTATLDPERDVVVAGRHFRARCGGSGPSVILVADYGQSMDETAPFVQSLAAQGRVCLYDRLGVGRSDAATRVQTFASLADDLDGVISGLGLARPVVVLGDTLGAPIALTWASRHEKDARGVLLTMPSPPGFMGPHGALSRLLPPRDPGDLELSNLWGDLDRFNDPATNRESLDPRSWDAYLRLPPTSTPLDGAWRQAQSRVLRLSSSSELVTVASQTDWPITIQRTIERALQG